MDMFRSSRTWLLGSLLWACAVKPPPPPLETGGVSVFEGEAIEASVAPPPASGGTLAVWSPSLDASGLEPDDPIEGYVVASVPESGYVHIVAVRTSGPVATHAIAVGDEPGRIAVDRDGRAHVAMRKSGEVVTLDIATGAILTRRRACAAARGIAYDAPGNVIHVACVTGELVTFGVTDPEPMRTVVIDRDLRDVLVLPVVSEVGSRLSRPSPLAVSRFREAELVFVDREGVVTSREGLPNSPQRTRVARVAWRAAPRPNGIAILYQLEQVGPVMATSSGVNSYYGAETSLEASPTSPVVQPVVVTGSASGGLYFPISPVRGGSPAMDIAFDSNGVMAVASADEVVVGNGVADDDGRFRQVTSVAFIPRRNTSGSLLVAQWRGPKASDESAAILRFYGSWGRPDLGSGSSGFTWMKDVPLVGVRDTGLDIFQTPARRNGIACATCHPEGGDDAHTWIFQNPMEGRAHLVRRTQSLRGGILPTAPFSTGAATSRACET